MGTHAPLPLCYYSLPTRSTHESRTRGMRLPQTRGPQQHSHHPRNVSHSRPTRFGISPFTISSSAENQSIVVEEHIRFPPTAFFLYHKSSDPVGIYQLLGFIEKCPGRTIFGNALLFPLLNDPALHDYFQRSKSYVSF